MKRKRQQSQKRKQRNWSPRNFIGGLKCLANNNQNECPHEKSRTMLLT